MLGKLLRCRTHRQIRFPAAAHVPRTGAHALLSASIKLYPNQQNAKDFRTGCHHARITDT